MADELGGDQVCLHTLGVGVLDPRPCCHLWGRTSSLGETFPHPCGCGIHPVHEDWWEGRGWELAVETGEADDEERCVVVAVVRAFSGSPAAFPCWLL